MQNAVINDIEVDSAEPMPARLHEAILDALERRFEHAADRIEVEVDGGLVTLRGIVDSWDEHEAVLLTVIGTRGVEQVVDALRIM
jgi:osmotically-inducible protein OsmY